MRIRNAVLIASSVVVASLTIVGNAQASPKNERHAMPAHSERQSCAPPMRPTFGPVAQCHAHVATNANGVTPMATTSFAYGYRPADLQKIYGIPAAAGAPTVAVVAAYDNPNIESDLAAYRSQFGLPACTTANGCFKKVNQTGGTAYPAADAGWAQEIALDLDMVSATCPNCKILLVEANSNGFNDLLTAIDYATANAKYVSNSWGTDEFSGAQNYESRLNKPGTVITFSTGDNGYGVSYPASSQYVVAVGGTSLKLDSAGNRTSETAWSGAGSGCSAYIAKPTWQTDSGCAKRAVADVSAVADPNTGVAVYTSYGSTGGNWWVFGGTSASAPIIAGVYAAAGAPAANTRPASYPYANKAGLTDITSGNNGTCSVSYLCNAVAGFDGPTGLGVPKSAASFMAPAAATTTNKAPVINSKTKSCNSSATCSFTVNASDPEGQVLTYVWTASTSTTKTATITFNATGTRTITVGVKDGVNTTYTSISVNCAYQTTWYGAQKLVCA